MPLKPLMPEDANGDVYKDEWQYQDGEYTVIRTSQWSGPGCHNSCGVLLYMKDGKVERVEGDPKNPYNNGRLCMRCLTQSEAIYHPERLKWPLKRVGERGENKWERISWDEAYDIIEEKVKTIWEEHGPESIVAMEGTGRNVIWQVPYLCHAGFKSPNFCLSFLSGSACYLPRSAAGSVQLGEQKILDASQMHPLRYNREEYTRPDVILIWGNNPIRCNADGFFGHWIVDLMKLGSKLIVVDPSLTWLASKADIWLRVRPGTDSALCMAFCNVIIEEDLYDHEFVEKWCYGFDKFREGVAEIPPEVASEICWVPAEKIRKAARMYATAPRAGIQWGLAIDQQPSGIAAAQGITSLSAITGNLDKPGGDFIPRWAYAISGQYTHGLEEIDAAVWEKRLGANLSALYTFGSAVAQEDSVLHAIETGAPYPIDMLWIQAANPIACMGAEAGRVYNAMKKVPFITVVDLFMTPTAAAFADLVLPAAMSCERNSIRAWWQPLRSISKVHEYYECKSDEQIVIDVGKRLNPEVFDRYEQDIDYLNFTLRENGVYPGTFEDLQESVFDYWDWDFEYEKYEKGMLRYDGLPGFPTPTGLFELSCCIFESFDYDSVPYHVEPRESPISSPELFEKYPLIMTTGQRSWEFFHSEHRQLPTAREFHPYPCVDIHPDAAKKYGIEEGRWIWIENQRGRFKQIAKFNPTLDPRVIRAEHGWWYPELSGEAPILYGVFDSNPNNCTAQFHNGPTGYSAPYKCTLAKVYPVKDDGSEILPTKQITELGGFLNYDDIENNDYGNFEHYGRVNRKNWSLD